MKPSKRALAADVLAAALLAAGTVSLFSNDLSLRIAGIRISMRTSWRPFVLAVVVLAIRNWLGPTRRRTGLGEWASGKDERYTQEADDQNQ